MELDGRSALITGGGTGIGRATALGLARRGCAVTVNFRASADAAEETAAEARSIGVEAIACQADVANDDDCRSLVASHLEAHASLDVLVNSAGTTVFVDHADLEGTNAQDWVDLYATNTIGPFQMMRSAAPYLREAGGEVVNVSSVSGVAGVGSSLPYCASKAALNNLTMTMARVLAPEARVNAIAPGFVTGRWWIEGQGQETHDLVADVLAESNLLRTVATPDDVAAAILNLIAGPDLTTGQVTLLDAGMLLGR